MSKGKKWKTPKKYHKKIDSWLLWNTDLTPHQQALWDSGFIPLHRYRARYHVGSGHNGRSWHKWHFRHRKYFRKWLGRMSMRKPMAIEIWYWD